MKKKLENIFEKYIYLSGLGKRPGEFIDEALQNLLLCIIASIALGIVYLLISLGLFPLPVHESSFQNILFLIPVPTVVGLLLMLDPYIRAQQHMKGAEKELLYVMALVTTYAANGVAPHIAINRLRRYRDLFKEFSKIVDRIEKIRLFFVVDEIEAMEVEGRRVISPLIADLLLSAASIERRGGDIYTLFREKMRSVFYSVREEYKSLADKMKFIGDVILMAYGMLPLMLYTMFALFASENLALQASFYSFLLNPLIGILLVFLIDSLYPKTPVSYSKFYRLLLYFVPVGVAVFAALYVPWLMEIIRPKEDVISGLPWLSVAIAAAATAISAPVSFRYMVESRRLLAIDYSLPSFVRDVAEEVKKGNTPALSIISLSKTRTYGSALDKIIRKMASSLSSGMTFEEACKLVMNEVSWYCRMSLALMIEADLMGAKPEVFDEVAEVTREIIDSIKIARSSVAPLKFFGLATAALVTGVTSLLIRYVLERVAVMAEGLYGAFARNPALAAGLGLQLVTPKMLPQLVDTIMAGNSVTMVIMGLMTGKMTDGTLAAGFQYVVVTSVFTIVTTLIFFLL